MSEDPYDLTDFVYGLQARALSPTICANSPGESS